MSVRTPGLGFTPEQMREMADMREYGAIERYRCQRPTGHTGPHGPFQEPAPQGETCKGCGRRECVARGLPANHLECSHNPDDCSVTPCGWPGCSTWPDTTSRPEEAQGETCEWMHDYGRQLRQRVADSDIIAVRAAIERIAGELDAFAHQEATCEWAQQAGGYFTSCGHLANLLVRGMKFCFHCGLPLREVPFNGE